MFKLSRRSIARREGIDEQLIAVSDLALTITRIDFGYPEHAGLRTAEVQNVMFVNKASKCDGYEKLSLHQQGAALDFYAYTRELGATWEDPYITHVAAAHLQAGTILGVALEWGGFWPWDKGHIQLAD